MKIAWSTGVGPGLAPEDAAGSDALAWPDFHEASKLPAAVARAQSTAYTTSPQEAFLVSRAFRQVPGPDGVPFRLDAAGEDTLHDVLARRRSGTELSHPLSLEDLSVVLADGLGPTQVLIDEQTGAPTVRRSWPSAGGLYPLDFYLIAKSVDGVPPGCYNVNTIAGRLEPLREGRGADVDEVLRAGWFWQEFMVEAAAVVVLAAVFERTVAKYGERGYRFALLDAGHAAQNLVLVATQQRLPSVPVGGFDDDALAAALGLDGLHEAVVHSVALGGPAPGEGTR